MGKRKSKEKRQKYTLAEATRVRDTGGRGGGTAASNKEL